MKSSGSCIIFAILILLAGCKSKTNNENRNDFAKYYRQYSLSGNFVMYDLKRDRYIFYNQAQAQQAYPPGATFKLFLSLVGFETGNIKIEGEEAADQLKMNWKPEKETKAFYYNTSVHYYENLTRLIGPQQIKLWLDSIHYGNADTTGGIPGFWLNGGLKISSAEQVNFLRQLYEHKLPFSTTTVTRVENMMDMKDTMGYKVKGKTGWAEQDNQDIGWYIGYIETPKDTYIFANCIQSADPGNPYFENARIDIANKILRDLQVIPE